MNNKQKILLVSAVILLVGLIVAGCFYWSAPAKKPQEAVNPLQEASNTIEQVTVEQVVEKTTQGTLPSLSANPMENKPDLNPVDKVNPIKDIKINPFD